MRYRCSNQISDLWLLRSDRISDVPLFYSPQQLSLTLLVTLSISCCREQFLSLSISVALNSRHCPSQFVSRLHQFQSPALSIPTQVISQEKDDALEESHEDLLQALTEAHLSSTPLNSCCHDANSLPNTKHCSATLHQTIATSLRTARIATVRVILHRLAKQQKLTTIYTSHQLRQQGHPTPTPPSHIQDIKALSDRC